MKSENTLTADSYLVTHHVTEAGLRLDQFLKDRYRKRSREQIKRAIESGAITLQREQGPHLRAGRLKPSSLLIPGDEVLVLSERRPEPAVSFEYDVLYEDDALFVINKPANLPVHPAGRYFFNTLLVHLRTRGHQDPLKAEREYFLVHRIDKETSGVLVLAKDRAVCTHLTRQFAERSTEKKYLAIVHGVPVREEFTVDLAMKRAGADSIIELKMKIAPESEGGQPALTRFRRLETYAGRYALMECLPRTGRQHQIRLHLESAGHPIVGDKLYGRDESQALRFYERRQISPEAEAELILPRHALHAASLKFEHPLTGIRMEFEAPLPNDLRAFMAQPPASARPPRR